MRQGVVVYLQFLALFGLSQVEGHSPIGYASLDEEPMEVIGDYLYAMYRHVPALSDDDV